MRKAKVALPQDVEFFLHCNSLSYKRIEDIVDYWAERDLRIASWLEHTTWKGLSVKKLTYILNRHYDRKVN